MPLSLWILTATQQDLPPPPPEGRSRSALLVAGAVASALVVAVALLLTGVIPGFHLTSNGSSGPGVSKHDVTFSRTGLPPGTWWGVTLGGLMRVSNSSIAFNEPNGIFSFTVGNVSGYAAAPSSGSVPVNGQAVLVNVTFSNTNSNKIPIGSALAIGPSHDGTNGAGTNYYNLTVESTSSSLTLGSFTLEIKSPSGTILVAGSTINGVMISALDVVITNPLNTPVATYVYGQATVYWNGCGSPTFTMPCGPTSPMTTMFVFSVQASAATSPAPDLIGCLLVAVGQGSFTGTTSGTIV